jgi:tRNA(Ile)-lysidine synthase
MSRFSPDALLMQLRELPDPTCYWVALSGGMDSRVLLHGLHALSPELAIPIKAIHLNHGLNRHAREWAYFCQQVCERLGIVCHVLTIDARPAAGQSPEAWARQLRYQAMEGLLEQGDILLIAHHQYDQAETLLLQLLRGAGPHGLAAMPRWVEFGLGWLGRPLLDFTRNTLKTYATAQGLTWIEDPSNQDTRFDRNLLRQAILPLLKQRWPSLSVLLAALQPGKPMRRSLWMMLPSKTSKCPIKTRGDALRRGVDAPGQRALRQCSAPMVA